MANVLTCCTLRQTEVSYCRFTVTQWRNDVGSALRQTFPRRPTDFSERELTFMCALRLSFVCLLSVTFVHRTQSVEIFGNVSTSFGT